ncbi:hypothetical protein BD311DRAFT_758518 [Dichomitus squalens]|uniref:Uncharacterized protein n=1 Tax=Dichomitus squalens TaxID=114155 RepID=A0A4Q9MPL1_9APHY|nr:hypothetical protein BD311DRAFT_758518 [Dichomitus squalens]
MDTVFSTQSSTDNPSEPGTSRDSRHRKRPHDAMGLASERPPEQILNGPGRAGGFFFNVVFAAELEYRTRRASG